MKSLRLLLVNALVAIFIMSCAALGSKTKVYNESRLKNIKTVGLVTKRFDQPRNAYHKIIKESFTKTLIDRLKEKGLFQLVIIDTTENEHLNIESISTNTQIDAILIAEWKLANPSSLVTDAKVTISIIDDSESKQLIARSSHGTKFGNSYGWTPQLPKTLLDATEGAINTLAKNIEK